MSARGLSLALAVLIAATALAACGRKDQPEPPSGKVPTNVYPKPDTMPGAPPAPAPAPKK